MDAQCPSDLVFSFQQDLSVIVFFLGVSWMLALSFCRFCNIFFFFESFLDARDKHCNTFFFLKVVLKNNLLRNAKIEIVISSHLR